ncbi:MAG: DDE transposase family protein [Boseongicola sp. SB0662_bin_57]|nr:DDE transposase family protein [Boseongicola sp. SB0662_bin_57]
MACPCGVPGHEVLLPETFEDPARFRTTVYRAANWTGDGLTRGFACRGQDYVANERPKRVFLLSLSRTTRSRLRAFRLDSRLQHGVLRMTLSVDHMEVLPDFFRDIDDPRRKEGRRHTLPSVLALATAPVLCGMRGYKAIKEWVDDFKPSELRRFRNERHGWPREWATRDVPVRVDPAQLDVALRTWQAVHGGGGDTAFAIKRQDHARAEPGYAARARLPEDD